MRTIPATPPCTLAWPGFFAAILVVWRVMHGTAVDMPLARLGPLFGMWEIMTMVICPIDRAGAAR